MYVKDVDVNNKSEFIINWYAPEDKVAFPLASKKDMGEQMPILKKSVLKYSEYAQKTYEELFPEAVRKDAKAFKVVCLSSSVLWNNQKKLELTPLPQAAQTAPVFAILTEDMDEDGIPDGCDDTIDDQDDEEVADLFEINQLYPNPTTGMLNLVLSSEATGTVLIYDVYGRVLAQYDLSQTKRLELYTNSLVAGTYMLVVRSGQEELASRRFVKLAY